MLANKLWKKRQSWSVAAGWREDEPTVSIWCEKEDLMRRSRYLVIQSGADHAERP